ncbi:hypothetical protein XA68_17488 [Ophiocordyceps unilateralis]|uniref:Uncharacterized protein n=1 Tax=Ophiocordyceps unilateralis TaxID=268505 RepID=A0A2A9P351_OPHUN|nr:hypothetical protein XA68_17488 [Ophiocordyceps unilateralis]
MFARWSGLPGAEERKLNLVCETDPVVFTQLPQTSAQIAWITRMTGGRCFSAVKGPVPAGVTAGQGGGRAVARHRKTNVGGRASAGRRVVEASKPRHQPQPDRDDLVARTWWSARAPAGRGCSWVMPCGLVAVSPQPSAEASSRWQVPIKTHECMYICAGAMAVAGTWAVADAARPQMP